jgi:hypothetical protein
MLIGKMSDSVGMQQKNNPKLFASGWVQSALQ